MSALLLLALGAGPAHAWQSHCYVDAEDRLCDDGYEKARHGWLSSREHPDIDQPEHAQLFLEALVESGVPQTINNPITLHHGASAELLEDWLFFQSIDPVAEEPAVTVERVVTPMEMAQLPDHSYTLWDWARGNETCPPDPGWDVQECHGFTAHMGALNSSHFPPQSQFFYAHYHALAVDRAGECATLSAALPEDDARLQRTVLACEQEAMLLEAIGQHYLQDAWSAGHMWERWGAPEVDDFPNMLTAFLIGSYSGTWHGAKAVLQKLPVAEWTTWDDPLCAPAPTGHHVEFRDPLDGELHEALGDIFRPLLREGGTYDHQRAGLMGCSIAGMREVYAATGRAHGPLEEADHPELLAGRDPTGETCFGQRVTNGSLDLGAQIHRKEFPNQTVVADRALSVLMPTLLQYKAPDSYAVDDRTTARLRRDMSVARALLAFAGEHRADGTDAASGGLSALNGMDPNSTYAPDPAHLGDTDHPPAGWLDPSLPWSLDGGDREQALVLAFSEAHAADLCGQSAEELLELPLWADGVGPATEAAEQARVDLCVQRTRPLLRLGVEGEHQEDQEPVCAFTHPAAELVYSQHEEPMDHDIAVEDWCTQRPTLVRNSGFERWTEDWSFTNDAERVTEHARISAPAGDFMLRLQADPEDGASYAVASQQLSGVPGSSGSPLPAGDYVLRFLRRTVTHEDNHWVDPASCVGHTSPWFVARLDSADPAVSNRILHDSEPEDWCADMERFDGAHYAELDFVLVEVGFTLDTPVPLAALTFQVGTSYRKRHIVLVDGVELERVGAAP